MFEMIAEEVFNLKRDGYRYVVICGSVKQDKNVLTGTFITIHNPNGIDFVEKILTAERQPNGKGIAIYISVIGEDQYVLDKNDVKVGAVIKEASGVDVDDYSELWAFDGM